MKTIKFIPAVGIKKTLLIKTACSLENFDEHCLICTKGSLSSQQQNLAWSFLFELPPWFDNILYHSLRKQHHGNILAIHEKTIKTKLDIIMEPSVEVVVQQLDILASEILQQVPKFFETEKLKNVYKKFYEFLTVRLISSTLPSYCLNQLQNMPVMYKLEEEQGTLEGKLLIPARVSLDNNGVGELQPFLYKYPISLGEYVNLFKALGCTDVFTMSQYCSVLEQIWRETEGKPLTNENDPNDIVAIKRAMHGLFSRLKIETEEEIDKISKIFVFTQGKCLQDLANTYYIDSNFTTNFRAQNFLKRLGSLSDSVLDISGIKKLNLSFSNFNLDTLFKKLPQNLKPVPLSSLLEEQITKECLEHVTCDEDKPGVQLTQYFKKLFNSESLTILIARILSRNSKFNDTYKTLHWKNEEELLAFVTDKLGSLNFTCCCKLTSVLVFGDEVQENSKETREYIISGTNDIYFDDNSNIDDLLKSEKLLTTRLSYKINELFSNELINFLHILIKVIKTKDKNKWKAILEKFEIPYLDNEDMRPACLPKPGTLVPLALHFRLQHTFSTFNKGEYVGFELEDPVETGYKGEQKFIFAIIENEVISNDKSQSNHLKIYSVWISEEEKLNIPAAMLYRFWKPTTYQSSTDAPELSNRSDAETLDDVTKMLCDVQYLPVGLQKKMVKRLLMQWIPENNHTKEELCHQVRSLITQHCDINLSSNNYDDSSQSDNPIQIAWQRASTLYKSSSKKIKHVRANELHEFLLQRTKVHRANQKRYEEDLHYSQKLSEESLFYLPEPDSKQSQPVQARKLFSQVEHDLEILESSPDSDWTFLTCYLVNSFSLFY